MLLRDVDHFALYIPDVIERRCEAALSILSSLLRCLGTSLDSFARRGGAFLRSSFALLYIPSYCPPTERVPNVRSANTLARRIAVNIAKLPDLLRR